MLACESNLLNRSIEKLVELALKRYNNILFAILSINPLQLSLVSSIGGWALNEGVGATEELLEDFIMVSLVGITGKFVLALGNSILKTVLTVLVIYAFHEWV